MALDGTCDFIFQPQLLMLVSNWPKLVPCCIESDNRKSPCFTARPPEGHTASYHYKLALKHFKNTVHLCSVELCI